MCGEDNVHKLPQRDEFNDKKEGGIPVESIDEMEKEPSIATPPMAA